MQTLIISIFQVVFASKHALGCGMYIVNPDLTAECFKGWHLSETTDVDDTDEDRMERQSNERSLFEQMHSPRALDPNGYV